jgi:hypothetical protein
MVLRGIAITFSGSRTSEQLLQAMADVEMVRVQLNRRLEYVGADSLEAVGGRRSRLRATSRRKWPMHHGNPRMRYGECWTDPRAERGEREGNGPSRLRLDKDLDLGGSIVRERECGDNGLI